MSDRLTDRLVSPIARASARKRAYTAHETNDKTNTGRDPSAQDGRSRSVRPEGVEDATKTPAGNHHGKEASTYRKEARARAGTLGGSNRLLSAREVAAILSVPERTVREKWREWELPAYRIGKHLRWKEREVHAWIDRHAA